MLLYTSYSGLSLVFSLILSFQPGSSINNVGVCIAGTLLCSGTLNFVTSAVPLWISCLVLPASCCAPVGLSSRVVHPLGTLSTGSSATKNRERRK